MVFLKKTEREIYIEAKSCQTNYSDIFSFENIVMIGGWLFGRNNAKEVRFLNKAECISGWKMYTDYIESVGGGLQSRIDNRGHGSEYWKGGLFFMFVKCAWNIIPAWSLLWHIPVDFLINSLEKINVHSIE